MKHAWITAAALAAVLALPAGVAAQFPKQGLKVHGRWVIEVRNADGSLAQRQAFDNALVPKGQELLAAVLSLSRPMGIWSVDVADPLCKIASGASVGCSVTEPNHPVPPNPSIFKNLTKRATGTFELVLQGTFVVANDGEVTRVLTSVHDPAGALLSTNFTDAIVAPGIRVSATQTVSVTVTISFS